MAGAAPIDDDAGDGNGHLTRFIAVRDGGLKTKAAIGGSPCRVSEQAKYRKSQWFPLQIIGFGLARGAVELFPYLRQPRKTGQVGVRIAVGAQPLRDPAIDTVHERPERDPITESKRIAQRMQLARIYSRQSFQERRGALMQLERGATEQVQRTRHA